MQAFLKDIGRYLQARWAFIAFLLVAWFLERHTRGKDLPLDAVTFATVALLLLIVVTGWRQLVRAPGAGIYFGFVGAMLFLFLFPVLFIALPFVLLVFAIDLFFVAPHRRLD